MKTIRKKNCWCGTKLNNNNTSYQGITHHFVSDYNNSNIDTIRIISPMCLDCYMEAKLRSKQKG